MALQRQREGAVRRGLHGPPAEMAAEQRAEVLEDRLAADDEDPGIHDGVDGVEAEGRQVLRVAAERADGVDEAGDLRTEEHGGETRVGRSQLIELISYSSYFDSRVNV